MKAYSTYRLQRDIQIWTSARNKPWPKGHSEPKRFQAMIDKIREELERRELRGRR